MPEKKPLTESFRLFLSVVICLSSAGGASWYLYQDLYQLNFSGVGPALGTIQKPNLVVKRKSAESFLWNRVVDGQPVYRNDSVIVGPESSVALNLKNGSQLEIGENSLITVDNFENLSLNFMRGNFIIRSSYGDRSIEANGTGKLFSRELATRLLAPLPEEVTYSLENREGPKEIAFRWGPPKTKLPISLDISTETKFQTATTRTYSFTPETTETKISLNPGKYFWRLRQKDLIISEVRKLKIARGIALKPVWPSENKTVQQWGNGGQIEFRWIADNISDSIPNTWIEISSDTSFKDQVKRHPVNPLAGMAKLSSLPEGQLNWRFVSELDKKPIPSTAQSFKVERVSILPIEIDGDSQTDSRPLPANHRFSWDFNDPEAEFELVVHRIANGNATEFLKQKASVPTTVWKNPAPGVYRWQVKAYRNGMLMGESVWRELSFYRGTLITLKYPSNKETLTHWENPISIQFDWEHPDAQADNHYSLEIAKDFHFKQIIHHTEVKAPPYLFSQFNSPDGIYFWRVKSLNESARIITVSSPSSFEYMLAPLLKAPIAILPRDGVTISVMQTESDPFLEWNPVDSAIAYEVSLRSEKTNHALQEETNHSRFSLKGFSAGKYDWSVRAIDRVKRKGSPSPSRTFTLHFGPLPAPKSVISEVE